MRGLLRWLLGFWGGLLFLLIGLLLVAISYQALPYIVHETDILGPQVNRPENLEKPGIVYGEEAFQKTSFFRTNLFRRLFGHGRFETLFRAHRLGVISDIPSLDPHGHRASRLVLVGTRGAAFLDRNGEITKRVSFDVPEYRTYGVIACDTEGDGVLEFLERGALGEVILFNADGNVRWRYGPGILVVNAAAGDVDDDGRAEVAVGFTGFIDLVNGRGEKLWRKEDGHTGYVQMADVDRDAQEEILHNNEAGELVIREGNGEIALRRRTAIPYLPDFSITRWGGEQTPNHLVTAIDSKIYILSFDGEAVAQFDAPRSYLSGEVKGVPVEFSDRGPGYATLINYAPWWRSVLYIHSMEGELIYQEIFRAHCRAVATLGEAPNEQLLVGCEDQVWSFSRPL